MSKITKNQRINQIADQLARQQGVISKLTIMVKEQNEAILMLEKLTDEKLRDQPEPQFKQLNQSVFDGLGEKWRWAATDRNGRAFLFSRKPTASNIEWYAKSVFDYEKIGDNYDASNWQDSLIERDIAKELLEVDLSSELTGSDLCRAMLARGDGYVVCLVSNVADSHAIKNREHTTLIEQWVERDGFYNYRSQNWGHAVPVNPATNEPLTASEVGL